MCPSLLDHYTSAKILKEMKYRKVYYKEYLKIEKDLFINLNQWGNKPLTLTEIFS